MIVSIWRSLWCLSAGKKSTSSFTFSFRYCKYITKLLFLVIWTCLATQPQKDTINVKKTFVFICVQKINFIPHIFLEILQRYANFLFWVLLACLVTHTQNYSINLKKTLFIPMPKIHLIIHFFLEILHFKETCNFIGRVDFGPNLKTRILPDVELVVIYQKQN